MKFLLFKLFLRIAIRLAPDGEVAHFLEQRMVCAQRQKEMDSCIRPRTSISYEHEDLEQ